MFNIRQQAGSFITGGLHHLTIELGQGRRHEFIPGGLIAGLSELFHNNEVAVGVHRHQAKPPSKRFVLSHSDVSAGHVLGQARGFGLAVGDHRFFHLTVDLLLRSIGGRDKAKAITSRCTQASPGPL